MDMTYAGVPFDFVDTDGVYREFVLTEDGADYLYTYWRIEAYCLMSPATAMSLSQQLQPAPGLSVPQIDFNIRHPLAQPRQQLILSMNGIPILSTPAAGDLSDAANGPIPKSFNIIKIIGDKSAVCRYVIECRVNECTPPKSKQGVDKRPVLLAQRWREVIDIDDDYFATRTVLGTAVFRSDALIRQETSPDELREQLAHPIPPNMKRDGISVTQESDGVTFRYQFTDSEKPFNWRTRAAAGGDAGVGLTRAEALETQWEGAEDPLAFAWKAIQGGPLSLGFAFGLGGIDIVRQLMFDQNIIAGNAISVDLNRAAWAMTARSWKRVHVRVWGHRASKRRQLETLALAIIMGRMSKVADRINANGVVAGLDQIPGIINVAPVAVEINFRINPAALLTGIEATMTHDLVGKFVDLSVTYINGRLANAVFGNINFPLTDCLFIPNDIPQLGQITTQRRDQQQVGPPPNSGGTRGTSISLLIAEALKQPCKPPSAPQSWSLFEDGTVERCGQGDMPNVFPADPGDFDTKNEKE